MSKNIDVNFYNTSITSFLPSSSCIVHTGSAVRIKRSFSSPEAVRDDVEVITGITERFVSRLVRVSVARYGGCLTNAGL
jgi:hypothetical protein